MLKAAVRREFDMVAAWSVDRLGRLGDRGWYGTETGTRESKRDTNAGVRFGVADIC
jgi:hypothetical protein